MKKGKFWNFIKKKSTCNGLLPLTEQDSKPMIMLKFFYVTLLKISPLLVLYLIYELLVPIYDLLAVDFGVTTFPKIIFILIMIVILLVMFKIPKILTSTFSGNKYTWKKFIIIAGTSGFLIVGFIFIHSVVGVPNHKWEVYDDSKIIGSVDCSDSQHRLVDNHRIYCSIDLLDLESGQLEINDWLIVLQLHNGTSISSNGFSFFAPEGINMITMNINSTLNNNNVVLSSRAHPKFYSKDDDLERQKDLLTYFFGLLFLTIITVPKLIKKIIDTQFK